MLDVSEGVRMGAPREELRGGTMGASTRELLGVRGEASGSKSDGSGSEASCSVSNGVLGRPGEEVDEERPPCKMPLSYDTRPSVFERSVAPRFTGVEGSRRLKGDPEIGSSWESSPLKSLRMP